MKIEETIQKRFTELNMSLDHLRKLTVEGTMEKLYPMIEFQQWATSVLSLLGRVFGQESIHYTKFSEAQVATPNSRYMLEGDVYRCIGIFQAAIEDYSGGYLFSVRALVEAEVLSDGLEQAEELLRASYKDAACIIAGVVLETVVKELCIRKNLSTGKLDTMNGELAKAGVYNKSMQKQITAWAGLRNDGAHGNWSAYTKEQVEQMVAGVNTFIATYL